MLATKNIYAQMCRKSDKLHVMTKDELLALQARLRAMYLQIEAVCERHGLTVMGAYGTVLGAMRHEGFIPWDDDLDLFMPRADYDRLINEYADELPANYKIFAPNSKNGPIYRFAKVVDISTKFVMPVSDETKESSGVFIDIFPLENAPTSKCWIHFRRYWLSIIMYIASSVAQYEDKKSLYKELMMQCRHAYINYLFRNTIGFLFSFRNAAFWYNFFDKNAQWKKNTGYYSVPSDSFLLNSFTPHSEDLFFPPQKKTFDDITISIPNKAEDYLCLEYANWREVPQDSERWQHFIQLIKL